MQNPHSNPLSRRNLLMAAPAAVAGAGLLGQTRLAAQDAAPAATANPGAPNANLGARIYNVRDFGARGDGQTLDTAAVQAAIDACTRDKGGTVVVPAGDFIVGTVELKSNVTLHLSPAGRLLGSGKPEHYTAGKGVPPGNGNVVLLYAADADNVTIEGRGTIDGQGDKFYTGKGDNTGPGGNRAEAYVARPHLAIFYRCRNLLVRDVFLTRSAYHCMRILECRYVHLDGVRIHNRVNLNNDGFHINSSEYVNIANCNVTCQDDACALFGSNRFVTVTNCTFSTRWSIFRFGNGQAENITISNCVVYDTYGCVIKMRCGAGSRIENVAFSNLIMNNVTGPISVGLDSGYGRPAQQTNPRPKGMVRNLMFNGIRATVLSEGRQYADMPFRNNFRPGETRTCITLNGVGDEFLEGITFQDIHVTYGGGGTAEEAARRGVPRMAGEYFELGTLPAYGMYARNVRGLSLNNIRFEVATPDVRPAMVFDRVEDAAVNGFSAQGNPSAESLLRFSDARDVLLTGCRVLTPATVFLQVEGAASQGITVDGGDLSKAAKPLSFAGGAASESVKLRS
ncbi:MAG: right-handed parallel beta-helix repeat-containing protein [Acidobacteriia bacterium]|nr:right-handed parallel beta-helix repeat-containing protein [Terriglobia bacterium]